MLDPAVLDAEEEGIWLDSPVEEDPAELLTKLETERDEVEREATEAEEEEEEEEKM